MARVWRRRRAPLLWLYFLTTVAALLYQDAVGESFNHGSGYHLGLFTIGAVQPPGSALVGLAITGFFVLRIRAGGAISWLLSALWCGAFVAAMAIAAWVTASLYVTSLMTFPAAALVLLFAPAVRYPCGYYQDKAQAIPGPR